MSLQLKTAMNCAFETIRHAYSWSYNFLKNQLFTGSISAALSGYRKRQAANFHSNFRGERCFLWTPHLLMCDRNESVFGKLSHDVEVRPHVQLAADKHHFGIGAELLCFTLPLCIRETNTYQCTWPLLCYSTRVFWVLEHYVHSCISFENLGH